AGAGTDVSGTARFCPMTPAVTAQPQAGFDPQRGLLVPVGEAQIDVQQGALRLSHSLDFDQSPGTSVGGDPALVYNSATVNVRPVVQLEVQTDPFGAAPVQAQVQLTWNGVSQTPVTIPLSVQAGQPVTLAAAVTSPVTQTG